MVKTFLTEAYSLNGLADSISKFLSDARVIYISHSHAVHVWYDRIMYTAVITYSTDGTTAAPVPQSEPVPIKTQFNVIVLGTDTKDTDKFMTTGIALIQVLNSITIYDEFTGADIDFIILNNGTDPVPEHLQHLPTITAKGLLTDIGNIEGINKWLLTAKGILAKQSNERDLQHVIEARDAEIAKLKGPFETAARGWLDRLHTSWCAGLNGRAKNFDGWLLREGYLKDSADTD